MRSLTKFAALLCLLLTVWTAAAVVAHHHANNAESQTCPVCVVARATAAPTAAGSPKPVFFCVSTVLPETSPARFRLTAFVLSIRPPPAV
jgi:hypothetical protein